MKVMHLTSAHNRDDTRIFQKMCISLANVGHQVTLCVADGLGDDSVDGVSIVDVGHSKGRLGRILYSTRRVYQFAKDHFMDIYHIHDPELIPLGLKLRRIGRTVYYDAHEDFPRQILSKIYLNSFNRRFLSLAAEYYLRVTLKKFSGLIAATPHIRDSFRNLGPKCIDINNYPLASQQSADSSYLFHRRDHTSPVVCYVGLISETRGIRQLLEALDLCKTEVSLELCGKFESQEIENEVRKLPGWRRVNYLGFLDRQGVNAVLERSLCGIVTLLPTPAYVDSIPVKMFEYLGAGLPIIYSKFPYWEELLRGYDCGIAVSPMSSIEIALAIDNLCGLECDRNILSTNGLKIVAEKCNWEIEEKKLLNFYDETILSTNHL